MQKKLILAFALIVFSFFLSPTVKAFHVSCSDNITTDTSLDSNLICNGTALTIGANNITLDGNGHTITGDNTGSGVFLSERTGVTVKNLNVKFFALGLHLNFSSNNSITANNITTASVSTHGILLVNSNNNTISNNSVESFGGAFRLGITLITSSQNVILSNSLSPNAVSFPTALNIGILLHLNSNNNTVSNNVARFSDLEGILLSSNSKNIISNNILISNSRGILLVGSSNNTLSNNTAQSNGDGFFLSATSNRNTLTFNTANDNTEGFFIASVSNNTLTSNTANNNSNFGFLLSSSTNNTLTSNIANNNLVGFHLSAGSSDNLLTNNTANNNDQGFRIVFTSTNNAVIKNLANNNIFGFFLFFNSNNNTIRSNTIINNTNAGINISASNSNLIFNNFFNNTLNARDSSSNFWNITKINGTNIIGGPFLGGNFWHDYAGVDTDGDGLGDTLLPYNSNGNISIGGDFLPLTTPSIINITNITFNFNITASPTNQTVRPGGNATYFIELTLINGTSQPVNLSVTVFRNTSNFVEPTILTSFLPPNVFPTGNSTLYLFTTDTTPQDSYTAVINAVSSNVSHSINVTLIVSGPPLPSNPISQSSFTVKLVAGTPAGNETRIPSSGNFILVFATGNNFTIIDNDATDGVGIIQLLSGNYKLFGRIAGGSPASSMTVLSPFIPGFVSPQSIQLNKTAPPTSVDLTSLNPFVLPLPAPSPIVDNTTKPWVSAFYPSTGLPYNLTNNGATNAQLIFVMQ